MLPKIFEKPIFKLVGLLFAVALLSSIFWPAASEAQWWAPWFFSGNPGNPGNPGNSGNLGNFGNSNLRSLPYFVPPSLYPSIASAVSASSPSQRTQTQGKKGVISPEYTMVPYEIRGLAAQGEYLCVIYARNGFDIWEDAPIAETGLAIFTLSAKGEPQYISLINLPRPRQEDSADDSSRVVASADKIVIAENLAFIIQKYPALLWIVDLSDPANPQMVNSLAMEDGILSDLAVGEEDVYLALFDGEESIIYALSLSSADGSDITPFFSLEGKTCPMLVNQGYLYAFDQSQGEGYVFNLQAANPEEPCGSIDITGENAVCGGNRLYMVTGHAETQSRLHIVDLTNPGQPKLQESFNLVGRELQVLLHNEYALVWKSSVFDTRNYLDILNVADPTASPKKVATVNLTAPPLSLACGEDCLYALSKSGLQVLDLSDPNDLSWVWEKPIDLSASLLAAELENNDYPMLDNSSSDIEITTQASSEFMQDGWFPWGLLYSFGSAFSPWNSSNTKGYGPVASAYSSLNGFPSAFGPWLGSAPYSSSGSYAYALGSSNSLDGGGNSTSSDYGYLNFPFCSFSGSDGYFPFGLVPPPSVSLLLRARNYLGGRG